MVSELRDGRTPIDLSGEEFRALGHQLVNALADFLDEQPGRRVTPGESPDEVRAALGAATLPERGTPPDLLLREACELLFAHSTFSGHPRFWAYIVGAPAPLGALADLLAAGVNPNLGGWTLAPIATEIEAQTVRWIAELVGFPSECGGLLVSGGNMANFVGFLCARRAIAGEDIRRRGTRDGTLCVYASRETHTWIQKAADLFGLGTDAIRWIGTNGEQRMDVDELRRQIAADRAEGLRPLLVVGAAGTVSTGAIDPLRELAEICRDEGIWFHVDGAYGAFAAALPDASDDLKALAEADSVALDPHKWLYVPVEAGCALVRDRQHLLDAFSYRPPYYHLAREDDRLNYFEHGPQNSRGFRALKVWLALRQLGREGYAHSIGQDVALARELFRAVEAEPELEAGTTNLSITTFRYVPEDVVDDDDYLNDLNSEVCTRLELGGEAYLSNAVVDGRFYLRACIVNFRTTADDVRALPGIVRRVGAETHQRVRR